MTPDIINDALSKLKNKNSSGPDNISTNLLKSIMPSIMGPICHLFNMSYKTGYIPTILKTGKIVPVFKTGESDKFTNYRPISLLSSFFLLNLIKQHLCIHTRKTFCPPHLITLLKNSEILKDLLTIKLTF